MRVISTGLSRLMRLVETGPKQYRIEQAVKKAAVLGGEKRWEWVPLAFATEWNEAHGALHQMQADLMDQMRVRKESFNPERFS